MAIRDNNFARMLCPEDERRVFLRRMRNPRAEVLQKRALLKKITERCKCVHVCTRCGDYNGTVKKLTSTLRIAHEKYSKAPDVRNDYQSELMEAVKQNKEIKPYLNKIQDDLTPIKVLNLFERMTDEDCEVLYVYDRPEKLIVTHLTVPPVAIRPSVVTDGGSNEDDITMKLKHIMSSNLALHAHLESGSPLVNCMETWDLLQVQAAMYINSDLPGLPPGMQPPGKQLRGFVQRLKGKHGRFRGNLSGKRVDFTGRTVISPDPNLKVTEVAVPMLMAIVLTYPEKVSRYNIEKLRQCVSNGPSKYPGANYVISLDGSRQ